MRLDRSCRRVKERKDAGRNRRKGLEALYELIKKILKMHETKSDRGRLFYCLPIGPVASSVWVSHRKGKEPEENHGR
jgi:hypothetical protein